MNESNQFGIDFCDYETGYAGKCGYPAINKSGRCVRHKGLKQRQKRVKQSKYSGDSKWREEMGQFQAKEGR